MAGLTKANDVAKTVLNTAFRVSNIVRDDNYAVQCLFRFKNYTRYDLISAGSYIGHGEMYVAPISSESGSIIEFMPRKGNSTLYGSLGAVFFQWEDQVLVLTWQIPLSDAGDSNELGVAVARSGVSVRKIRDAMSGSDNARDMEYKARHLYDRYDTKIFDKNTLAVWIETLNYVWRATMGSCRKTEGSVELIPKSHQLLAKNLSPQAQSDRPSNPPPGRAAEGSKQLSAESSGQRTLRTFHGTFLSAPDVGNFVDQAQVAQAWEHWYVEDWGGKVVFKAIHSPGRFISTNPDGYVDLTFAHPNTWEKWSPHKNSDGSWSFRGFHGRWLSARQDGSVSTIPKCDAWEHFWLGSWTATEDCERCETVEDVQTLTARPAVQKRCPLLSACSEEERCRDLERKRAILTKQLDAVGSPDNYFAWVTYNRDTSSTAAVAKSSRDELYVLVMLAGEAFERRQSIFLDKRECSFTLYERTPTNISGLVESIAAFARVTVSVVDKDEHSVDMNDVKLIVANIVETAIEKAKRSQQCSGAERRVLTGKKDGPLGYMKLAYSSSFEIEKDCCSRIENVTINIKRFSFFFPDEESLCKALSSINRLRRRRVSQPVETIPINPLEHTSQGVRF